MITLPLQVNDINKLHELHEQHYGGEFFFPDFSKNFLTTFKILNDKGEIITAGGVRLFPELILITDIEKSGNERAFAVTSALQISTLVAQQYGMLFCSAPKGTKWHQQIINSGFQDSRDHNLVLPL